MTVAASKLVEDARTELQDLTGVRWPTADLVKYLNLAQVAVVKLRPDTKSTKVIFTPAQGARQALPDAALEFMDITCNAIGRQRQIRKVSRAKLDAISPLWQSMRPATEIINYTFDQREPRVFVLYPPAATAARIELVFAAYPAAVAAPTGNTVVGNIDLPDWCESAVLSFMLHKAWSKDGEFAENKTLADAKLAQFKDELANQLQSATVAVATQ